MEEENKNQITGDIGGSGKHSNLPMRESDFKNNQNQEQILQMLNSNTFEA